MHRRVDELYLPLSLREFLLEYVERDAIVGLARYGADAGFPYLEDPADTSALYAAYEEDAWREASVHADRMGTPHPLAAVARVGGVYAVGDQATFANLMVWTAVEEVAERQAAEWGEDIDDEEDGDDD